MQDSKKGGGGGGEEKEKNPCSVQVHFICTNAVWILTHMLLCHI